MCNGIRCLKGNKSEKKIVIIFTESDLGNSYCSPRLNHFWPNAKGLCVTEYHHMYL